MALDVEDDIDCSGPGRDQGGGEGVVGGEGQLANGMMPNNKSKSTSQLSAGTLRSTTYFRKRSKLGKYSGLVSLILPEK